MKSRTVLTLTFGLLLAVAGVATAADQTPADIVSYQKGIRAKVDAHQGEYARLSTAAARNITDAQDKIFRMLDGVNSLDDLTPAQRTELSDALERVKSGLLANDGSRLICRSETPIGSNISRKRCETVASREARMRESQTTMGQMETASRAQQTHGN